MKCDNKNAYNGIFDNIKNWGDAWEGWVNEGFKKAEGFTQNAQGIISDVGANIISAITGKEKEHIKNQMPNLFIATEIAKGLSEQQAVYYGNLTQMQQELHKLHLNLKRLNKDTQFKIGQALDGTIPSHTLSESEQKIYTALRENIDAWQDSLIEIGMLNPEFRNENYIFRTYASVLKSKTFAEAQMALKKLYKRQDLTPEQREAMGQILIVSDIVPLTLMVQRKQYELGAYLKSLAESFGRDDPAEGYVQVPDYEVGGGIKKFGALSGKYVPHEVALSLKLHDELRGTINGFALWFHKTIKDSAIVDVVNHIKVNLTVKNPITHLGNAISNVVLSYINGDMTHTAKVMGWALTKDPRFDELLSKAQRHGLSTQRVEFENLLRGDEIFDIKKAGTRETLIGLLKAVYLAEGTKAGDFMRKAYDWEDAIFKLGSFQKNLERGMTEKDAFDDANWTYVNYRYPMPNWLQGLDRLGFAPFLHYSYKATPATLKTIIKRPSNLLRYLTLQAGIVLGGASYFGNNDDIAKPEWARDVFNLFLIKNWTNIGGDSYINTARWFPGGKFDTELFSMSDWDFKMGLGFWGSLSNIMQGMTPLGYPISSKHDDTLEKAIEKFKVLGESFLPPLFPFGGRYPMRGIDLLQGKLKNYYGEDMEPKEYYLRLLGLRVFNTEKEIKRKFSDVANREKVLKDKLDAGKISYEKYLKEKKGLDDQKYNLTLQKMQIYY